MSSKVITVSFVVVDTGNETSLQFLMSHSVGFAEIIRFTMKLSLKQSSLKLLTIYVYCYSSQNAYIKRPIKYISILKLQWKANEIFRESRK